MKPNSKYLETIAKEGTWEEIQPSQISMDEINRVKYGIGSMKTNIIGIAAQHKSLNKFPREFYSREGILAKNDNGETPLHFICSRAKCEILCIPKKFITEEIIVTENKDGTTPLHYLSFHGNLKLVEGLEPNLLRDKNLEKSNKHGLSALDFALLSLKGALTNLSYPPLDKENQRVKIETSLRLILSRVSSKFLKEQLNLPLDSKLYKEKSDMVKRELLKRDVIQEIQTKANSLELS